MWVSQFTPTYTWQLDGKSISNSNFDSYTINHLLVNGTYTVNVSYAWEIVSSNGSSLTTPIKGVLIYQKSITLNVNDSNVKLTLNDNNLVNNEITNLGNQALSASVSVSFDNNQTYQTLANSVFANSNFQLAFGTLDSSGKFSAFSTNQVNNANAWATNYMLSSSSSLQAQLQINRNEIISSNLITCDIANASLSAITPSVASASSGTMLAQNEYAFGSQVQLSTNFTHPNFNIGNNEQITSNVTYAWYANDKLIDNATKSSYIIPTLLENTTYKVMATWTWYVSTNQTDVHTQTFTKTIDLAVNDSNAILTLTDENATNNIINSLGEQSFKVALSAIFDNGKATKTFTNIDFANSAIQIQYFAKTSASSSYSKITNPINLSNQSAWSLDYLMQDATSFEAQIINPNSSSSPIVSNSITTKITAPSLSPIKASVASNSVGEAISNTEFAFASQVTLTTNFVHQTISVPAGQTLTDVVTYAWYANDQLISNANSASYTTPDLLVNTTYKVVATWTWYIGNNKQNAQTQTFSSQINLSVNYANVSLALSTPNITNDTISNLGYEDLSASLSVNFGKNTPTKILSASEFKNTAFTIAFGTLNNNNFSALATNDASATSSWNYAYIVKQNTILAAQFSIGNNHIVTSNALTVNITTPSLSASANIANENSGTLISTNEFAFGSQVVLNADFIKPTVNLEPGVSDSSSITYTWYENGNVIANQTTSTYTISHLFANASYSVKVTWSWTIGNTSFTQTYASNNINLSVNLSDIKLALISSNLVNGKINTLGANKLNATIQVVFSGNTINLNATDFANTSFQIDFGTVNNQVFTSLGQNATGDASNNSSWSYDVNVTGQTTYEVEFLNAEKTVIATSNQVTTDFTNITINSTTTATTGKQIAANEYAFGSDITLSANYTTPSFGTSSITPTYTWFLNGTQIKGANSKTYTIAYFLNSAKYSVTVSWTYTNSYTNKQSVYTINGQIALTVNNNNISFDLTYGNNQTQTITSNNTQTLTPVIKTTFDENTVVIPTSDLTSLTSWNIEYERFSFSQWNVLSTINFDSTTITYNYNPTGIYPLQALLSANGKTFTSNMIQVNTTYNGDVLDFANLPSSIQSTYNCLTFIKDYITTSIANQGSNSLFMQQVNDWTNGYLMIENIKPTGSEKYVPVAPTDLTNFSVNWTNPNSKESGVIVSATVANANGLSLMTYQSQNINGTNTNVSYYGDAGSITLNKGDVIKWLLPFGTSNLTWSVINQKASANFEINSALTPYPFTSIPTGNNQNEWEVYNGTDASYYGYQTVPKMDAYYWGFTVESANGTNLLTNAIKTLSFYENNIPNDKQWIIYGSFPLIGDNTQNPAIIFNSTTSTLAQSLYDLSIAKISSLN